MDMKPAFDYLEGLSITGQLAQEIINKALKDVDSIPDKITSRTQNFLFFQQVKFRVELINKSTQQAIETKQRIRKFRKEIKQHGLNQIWF